MQDTKQLRVCAGLLLAFLLSPGSAGAAPAPDVECEHGAEKVGWLGITSLEVASLRVHGGDDPWDVDVWFGQEPEVRRVAEPAAGRLRPGDVITAVDGKLITTRRGGYRLARPVPGEPVTLKVRRDGREIEVEVVPTAVCPEDALLAAPPAPSAPSAPSAPPALSAPPAPPAPSAPPARSAPPAPRAAPAPSAPSAPSAPTAPRAPSPPPAPPAPPASPSRAWFGFGFECRKCGWKEETSGDWSYFFDSPPEVFSVDPGGPADRAGLQRGDLLTHADGLPITSNEGARRLFGAEPGTSLRLTYERDGSVGETRIHSEEPPTSRGWQTLEKLRQELDDLSRKNSQVDTEAVMAHLARRLASLEDQDSDRDHLRFAGSVGDVDVEVRGLDSVQVTVDESEGTVVIRTLDAVVRLAQTHRGTP